MWHGHVLTLSWKPETGTFFFPKLYITCILGDYKWCQQVHKFIGKKVTATQKLNAQHYKEQLKKFFSYPMQVQSVLHLLPCTYQDDIWLCAKHSAVKADQFLQLLFIFSPSSYSGLLALAECKPCLSQCPTGKSRGGSDLELAEAREWTPLANPSLRQIPIPECCHLIMDVWWHSITLKNNVWFVVK
jgi:hypothetical protein